MTTPDPPADSGRHADPYLDMRARWCPSPAQDAHAAAAMARLAERHADQRRAEHDPTDTSDAAHRSTDEEVFTVQLLVGKHHGLWTRAVEVRSLPGVYYSREAALAACAGARVTHRLLCPGVPVTASYCWHHTLASATALARGHDGRMWRTHWSVFEDLSGEPDEDDESAGD